MILDTSALVAILRDEPGALACAEAIERAEVRRLSAASYVELGAVIDRVGDAIASRRVDALLDAANVQIETVTEHQASLAREAFRDFGKGSGHPAKLNFGDCFSYALAKVTGEALLFKGEDFAHTDVTCALPEQAHRLQLSAEAEPPTQDGEWTLRDATKEDVEAVFALWEAAGSVQGAHYSPAALRHLLEVDARALILAEVDGVLVGSLIAASDGWRGNLYRLAVAPEHRRRGLAARLLREGERRLLRERGLKRLSAIVVEGESEAIAFWRAAGYELQPDRTRFVRNLD